MHQSVADYYRIACINLNSYVRSLVNAGTIIWNDQKTNGTAHPDEWYSGDGTHPNDKGYRLYTDYIIERFHKNYDQYFKKLTWRETPVSDYEYGRPSLVPHNDDAAVYSGNWSTNTDRLHSSFQAGLRETTEAGASVTFRFTGRSIGLYGAIGDIGTTADYVIDEDTAHPIRGTISHYAKYHVTPDNQGNPVAPSMMAVNTMLRSDLSYGKHVIKITVNAPTNQNGYVQNLFSFGCFFVDPVQPSLPPCAKDVRVSGVAKAGSSNALCVGSGDNDQGTVTTYQINSFEVKE